MTQDYGAAQPIADWVDSHVYRPVRTVLGTINKVVPDKLVPSKTSKEDTSWHDDMVRKANDSFRKAAETKSAPKTPPKYHKGADYVPKTGPAILKKGEAVLNEKDAEKYRAKKEKGMAEKSHGSSRASHVLGGKGKSKSKEKSSKKHPHKLTISHGKSGGHKVVHSFLPDENGMTQPDEEHILPDKASLMQHIDENTPDVPAPQAAPPDAGTAGASTSVAPPPPPPPPGM